MNLLLGKNKGENIMANNVRPIEYTMNKKTFDNLLKTRKDNEKKMNPYKYVMNIINEQYGLRGTVNRLNVYEK
jgi:hypothetical protein